MPGKKKEANKAVRWTVTIMLWILAAWLVYPLVNLDTVDMSNVIGYLYRSALGLTLLVIFLGKTLFDIIFPWVHDRKLPALNALLLTLYALALTGGIIFMVLRIAMLYMRSRTQPGPVI
jgi:uncharacterized membrane protein YhdT